MLSFIPSSVIDELVGVQHDPRTMIRRFNTANVITNPVFTGARFP